MCELVRTNLWKIKSVTHTTKDGDKISGAESGDKISSTTEDEDEVSGAEDNDKVSGVESDDNLSLIESMFSDSDNNFLIEWTLDPRSMIGDPILQCSCIAEALI